MLHEFSLFDLEGVEFIHADGWQGNASFVLQLLDSFCADETLEVMECVFPHLLHLRLVVTVPLQNIDMLHFLLARGRVRSLDLLLSVDLSMRFD